MPDTAPLPPDFYHRNVVDVARDLIGCLLTRQSRSGRTVGRIVETEAYLASGDPACHAARGMTRRNLVMFGAPGKAYVYSIHTRFCLNAVSQAKGEPAAVLIRAVEPLDGIDLMAQRRGTDRMLDLARGPGRLCEAFQIDRRLDDFLLTRGTRLWIAPPDEPISTADISASSRIGIRLAQDLPLRFFLDGSPFVSGPRRWHRRPIDHRRLHQRDRRAG